MLRQTPADTKLTPPAVGRDLYTEHITTTENIELYCYFVEIVWIFLWRLRNGILGRPAPLWVTEIV